MPDADHAVLAAECGKGTYVRALARDLGRALGALGHVSALRRSRVGPFAETDMISLERLELCHRAAAGEGNLADMLLPVETALDDIPALAVSPAERQGSTGAKPFCCVDGTPPSSAARSKSVRAISSWPLRGRPRRDRPQARVQFNRRDRSRRQRKRLLTMSITAERKAELITDVCRQIRRHRVARSAGGAPFRADQQPDRSLQDPHQGQPLPARAAQARVAAASVLDYLRRTDEGVTRTLIETLGIRR